MHILLTNDDGIFAPGLAAIYRRLAKMGRVTVVAPSDPQSGAGHSITLEPLACSLVQIENCFSGYSVAGSPADCVKLALMQLIKPDESIDLVVSGINQGANVGINVFYSGTVAAAIEGAFFGIPSAAISAAWEEKMDFESAADYAMSVLRQLGSLRRPDVININIPRLSQGKPKGIKVVPQATGGFEENYIVGENQTGQIIYKLNGGSHKDSPPVTADTVAICDGFITVSALQFDMTDHKRTRQLQEIKWEPLNCT